jgi:hypothetical protein
MSTIIPENSMAELFACYSCGFLGIKNWRDSAHGCPVCGVTGCDIGQLFLKQLPDGGILIRTRHAPHTEPEDGT